MKQITILLLILIILPIRLVSQPIPPDVKSVVAFVFVPDSLGKPVANGTGFFVGVPIASKPTNYAVYLVTAKHVLQIPNTSKFFSNVLLRLNQKTGNVEFGNVDLNVQGKSKNVFLHPDSTVDIAVVPLLPDQDKYDFKFLPADFITSKQDFDSLKITEGSEIFFTGLFIPHMGEHHNYPIVRFGRVALISPERIDWEGIKAELYLVESMSFGGNSGSPVFFYLGANREPGRIIIGSPVLKLAGIMEGFFGEKRPIELVRTGAVLVSISNIGIAAVTPAYLLHEILFSKELSSMRGF